MCLIPKENHFETLRHLTHYILQISSTMQGWEIVWFVEDDILIEQPLASFNNEGKWDKITTHQETDLIKCFKFVYDIFQNNFLNNQLIKQPNRLD